MQVNISNAGLTFDEPLVLQVNISNRGLTFDAGDYYGFSMRFEREYDDEEIVPYDPSRGQQLYCQSETIPTASQKIMMHANGDATERKYSLNVSYKPDCGKMAFNLTYSCATQSNKKQFT